MIVIWAIIFVMAAAYCGGFLGYRFGYRRGYSDRAKGHIRDF